MELPTPRKLAAIVGLPVLVVVIVAAFLFLIQDRLPEQVATHWGLNGTADGFTSSATLPWLAAAISFGVAAPLMALSLMAGPKTVSSGPIYALPSAVTAFIAVITALSAAVSTGSNGTPTFPVWVIPVAAVAGLTVGWGAVKLAGAEPTVPITREPAPAESSRFPLDDGKTAVWSGRTSMGRTLIGLIAFVGVVNSVVAVFTSWWLLPLIAVTVFVILATSSFKVTAGPGGVHVAGALGYPRTTIPLNQITSAEAGSVRARQFGGFGWRVGRKGQTAVLTRSGHALTLTRTDGAQLHVTLDDPERPAAVISTLLDQRAAV